MVEHLLRVCENIYTHRHTRMLTHVCSHIHVCIHRAIQCICTVMQLLTLASPKLAAGSCDGSCWQWGRPLWSWESQAERWVGSEQGMMGTVYRAAVKSARKLCAHASCSHLPYRGLRSGTGDSVTG